MQGFRACVRTSFSLGVPSRQDQTALSYAANWALYQGTTLVGPKLFEKMQGFKALRENSTYKLSAALILLEKRVAQPPQAKSGWG
jgi:hypothetical protein